MFLISKDTLSDELTILFLFKTYFPKPRFLLPQPKSTDKATGWFLYDETGEKRVQGNSENENNRQFPTHNLICMFLIENPMPKIHMKALKNRQKTTIPKSFYAYFKLLKFIE